MNIMIKLTVLGVLTEHELENEVANQEKELWDDKKFFRLRFLLIAIFCYWIGYFCYWFCQDSLLYYIKHFEIEEQLPVICMMIISALMWFILAKYWYIEFDKRIRFNRWYDNELYKMDLKDEIELYDIKDFIGFSEKDENILINYLTNKVIHSIIINEEICKLGILDDTHDELVIDFGKKIIYSK